MALAGRARVSNNAERTIGTTHDVQPATLCRSARLHVFGILPSGPTTSGNPEQADVLPGGRPNSKAECQASAGRLPSREHLRPALAEAIHEARCGGARRWQLASYPQSEQHRPQTVIALEEDSEVHFGNP